MPHMDQSAASKKQPMFKTCELVLKRFCGWVVALALVAGVPSANACSRIFYIGKDGLVIVGRSLDWFKDQPANIWAFPRGMQRDGGAGPSSLTWKSKYGMVGTSSWDIGVGDGVNEKGLSANMLYLAESQYPKPQPNDPRKPIALSLWPIYMLDNFATVAEAVDAMKAEPFYVVPAMSPDGKAGTLHLSLADATGDSAIFEYIAGKLVIHHGRQYQVMTNSPVFSEQLALNDYWKDIGDVMLPGTQRAADRFVRASHYLSVAPQTADAKEGVATAFSIIRNVSVPLGVSDPQKPNISPTIWRSVSDLKNKRYFFESVRSPNVFWVDLADMDFSEGAKVQKLTLDDGSTYAGNASKHFKPSEMLKFMPADPIQK